MVQVSIYLDKGGKNDIQGSNNVATTAIQTARLTIRLTAQFFVEVPLEVFSQEIMSKMLQGH